MEAVYADESIWLTQKMMGVLYDVNVRTVNEHLKKIFVDSELQEDSVIRKFRITASDGKRYNTQHYKLPAIIAVGYKVNSERAVQFRKSATGIIEQFTIKAYVMDDERIKAGGSILTEQYFDFALGDDVLNPYKMTIDRWLWPDVFKNQDISVSKAKKAISDYKKAIGRPEGVMELMVFYCERAAGFSKDIGLQDEGYFNSLVRMFEAALKAIQALPAAQQTEYLDRLDEVRHISHHFGYGVGDNMNWLWKRPGWRS